jgi:Tol biopolymer transport system component
VLVAKSGVKVLDFGLAKLAGPPSSENRETRTARPETEQGVLVGTLAYMSPEQAEAKPVDARSDIFSFGSVLYEMLTGRRAFEGGSNASLAAAILRADPPPVSAIQSLVPKMLDRVLRRCLAKDPGDRWQSAGDLKAALEWLAAGLEEAVPIARREWWKDSRIAWTLVAALAGAVAFVGWIHWNQAPALAPLVRLSVDPPPGLQFYRWTGPSVSPDGERILVDVAQPQHEVERRTWMYRISTGESAPFYNVAGYFLRYPWSTDSGSFAIRWRSGVHSMDLTGARREVLQEQVSDFAWGPSGSYLFAIDGKGLFWAERGSSRRQVTVQQSVDVVHELPQLLPDGKSFLFHKRQGATVETWLGRLDGKESKRLLSNASQARFAPPDYLIYLAGGSLFAQRFNAGLGGLTGDPRALVSGVATSLGEPYGLFSVSRNVLAFRQGPVNNPERLMWLDRSGNVIGTLGEVADYTNPALSPDGRHLAVCIREPGRKRNIWIFDLARGTKTCLKFQEADETNPIWSPDGSEIAYSSDRRGHRDLYAMSASGSGPERVLLESGEDKSLADWSADGSFLLYSVPRGTLVREVWILPLTSNARMPVRLNDAPYRQGQAVIAPDGHSVLHTSMEGDDEVFEYLYLQRLQSSGGRKWQIATAARDPCWRGDGREIFYRSSDALMAAEIDTDGSPGPPHQLFPLQGSTVRRLVATRDGQRFLAVMPAEVRDPATIPFVVILNWQRLLADR